jgi:uridine kinase
LGAFAILTQVIHIKQLLSSAKQKTGNTTIIAIDGRSGSGKSTLAKLLSLKLECPLIHTDDFSSWDNPMDWYPALINDIFIPIMNGAKSVQYQPIKARKDKSQRSLITQPIGDLLIIEGVSASRQEFRDYISLSIFVDAPKDISIKRGFERDLLYGQSEKKVRATWELWSHAENIYIQRDDPKANADIVLDGTKPFEEQIELT